MHPAPPARRLQSLGCAAISPATVRHSCSACELDVVCEESLQIHRTLGGAPARRCRPSWRVRMRLAVPSAHETSRFSRRRSGSYGAPLRTTRRCRCGARHGSIRAWRPPTCLHDVLCLWPVDPPRPRVVGGHRQLVGGGRCVCDRRQRAGRAAIKAREDFVEQWRQLGGFDDDVNLRPHDQTVPNELWAEHAARQAAGRREQRGRDGIGRMRRLVLGLC